jgi:hypothetical protein
MGDRAAIGTIRRRVIRREGPPATTADPRNSREYARIVDMKHVPSGRGKPAGWHVHDSSGSPRITHNDNQANSRLHPPARTHATGDAVGKITSEVWLHESAA